MKHILVHLDGSPQSRSRLKYALDLASCHKAFLTGCYTFNRASADYRQEVREQLQTSLLHQGKANDVSSEWMSLDEADSNESLAARVCRAAQCSDLVIAGQPNPQKDAANLRSLLENLIMFSGRPVIVVPFAGEFNPKAERVMVAWSGGRESARAVHDALPLLKRAGQVVLTSLLLPGAERSSMENSLARSCEHLAHHGLQPRPELQVCVEVSKGDLLLNRCAEEGIELLVAGGCYKGALGKVARHLLQQMTVPVLMAH